MKEIEVLRVRPGEKLVLHVPSREDVAAAERALRRAGLLHRTVLVAGEVELAVVEPEVDLAA